MRLRVAAACDARDFGLSGPPITANCERIPDLCRPLPTATVAVRRCSAGLRCLCFRELLTAPGSLLATLAVLRHGQSQPPNINREHPGDRCKELPSAEPRQGSLVLAMAGRSSSAARVRSAPKAGSDAGTPPTAGPRPRLGARSRTTTCGAALSLGIVLAACAAALVQYDECTRDMMLSLLDKAQANPVVVGLAASTLMFAALAIHFWADARGGVWKAIKVSIIGSIVSVPGIKGAVDGVMTSMIKDLEDEMLGGVKEDERIRALPEKGMSAELVLATIEASAAKDKHHWSSGKLSGTIYHGGDDLSKIIAVRPISGHISGLLVTGRLCAHNGLAISTVLRHLCPAGRRSP